VKKRNLVNNNVYISAKETNVKNATSVFINFADEERRILLDIYDKTWAQYDSFCPVSFRFSGII